MEEDSNARWFYRRCSAARIVMETPLSTLDLSLRVFRFVESIVEGGGDDDDDDDGDAFQLRLFGELRDGCMARRRDLNFVYEICDRAFDLRDDDDFTEETIRAVAGAEATAEDSRDGDGVVAIVVGRESRGGGGDEGDVDAVVESEADGEGTVVDPSGGNTKPDVAAVPSSSATSMLVESESSSARDGDDDRRRRDVSIDSDGLQCFQLRTRVFGLSLPTFTTELWRYLQLAGWTHSPVLGYHIPKRGKDSRRLHSEDIVKRIYDHFDLDLDLDDDAHGRNGAGESLDDGDGVDADDEEGPEIFDSSNDLVDYLDEYCLPDYRATTAEIEAGRMALIARSTAYRRRNLRLRHELLEVAYNERLRKRRENLQSKYGHDHRPCEICFKGANAVYPRVACRGCGLVAHTNCYGLLDHGDKGGEGDAARVDDKGYFTCDVCAIGSNRIACKHRGQAPQRSGWRVEAWRLHQHPDAVCSLCNWKYIAGGMVRIADDKSDAVDPKDAKNRKRKSRRTEELSESWVHLFCINALPSKKKVFPGSVRSGRDAAFRIREALDNSGETVREIESMRVATIRCETCAKGKGDLVRCDGSCGRFYHRLCLQIDLLDYVGWGAKTEHLCLSCRNVGGGAHVNSEVDNSVKYSKSKGDNSRVCSSKTYTQGGKSADEIDQYFSKKSGKASKPDGERSDLVMPSQQECIAEVEILHRQCNIDIEFDKFEVQYQQQFDEWSFSLATSQSILLYGFGSKISLLARFGNYLAQEGDVISLNGYDPNINMSIFLGYMGDIFCDGRESYRDQHARESSKGLAKMAASIAKHIASTRSRPLFVLIHNIDGIGLRNPAAQDSIATLTANSNKDGSPLIRVVASVDNVNAAVVLWSPEVEHKFDWAWKMVHTHRPYFEEVHSMPQTALSKKAKKRNGSQVLGGDSAALKVLSCLAPRHTEVLQALATVQYSSALEAVSYGMLRDECTRKMLPSSDAVLRNILKELSDHRIVALERGELGNETVCIPPGILPDILNFKHK